VFKRCLNTIIVFCIRRYGDRYTKVVLEVAKGNKGVREAARELQVSPAKISHAVDLLRRLIG